MSMLNPWSLIIGTALGSDSQNGYRYISFDESNQEVGLWTYKLRRGKAWAKYVHQGISLDDNPTK